MSIRTERVSSFLKEEVGAIIEKEFSGASVGFVTVTDVHISPDLRNAKIYISVMGDENIKEKSLDTLNQNSKHIRHIIGSHLQMKFTPSVEFFLDDTLDRVEKIDAILKKIHDDSSSELK